MKTLDEIKQMMVAGDTAQADEALKELLAKDPENLQAKMLYGTCRQFLGDEETFKRIHDELAPVMEREKKTDVGEETVSLWKKYHALWMSLIVGGLLLIGVGAVKYLSTNILDVVAIENAIQPADRTNISPSANPAENCCAAPDYRDRFKINSEKRFLDTDKDEKQ